MTLKISKQHLHKEEKCLKIDHDPVTRPRGICSPVSVTRFFAPFQNRTFLTPRKTPSNRFSYQTCKMADPIWQF